MPFLCLRPSDTYIKESPDCLESFSPLLGAFSIRFWVPRAILPEGGGASFGGCRPANSALALDPPAEVLRPANRSDELPDAFCDEPPSPKPPFAAVGMLSMLLELIW